MIARDAQGRVTMRAMRVPSAFVFDGVLEEPFYRDIKPVGDFIQQEPNEGAPATEKTEDMLKAGIVDPAKVTKSALQNAASIAGLMLTTEALVSEIKEKEKAPQGAPGGGGMGGMY